MSAPIQLQDLIADVVHTYPSALLDFDPMPSGVCFLWLTLNGRQFVIEYDPKRGTGVSENCPDTPPFVGHDQAFASLDDGIARLKSLLADAACTEAATSSNFALNDKPSPI